jgi:ribosomal protein S18 acetylase RimI-like enzyme
VAEADLYRDLYAALAADLVREGFFYHQAVVPAGDQGALLAWFSLSFGQEQVHALQPVWESEPEPTPPPGIAIRRATPADLDAILTVAHLIAQHQAASPVFGALLPEQPLGWREGWTEMLADPNAWVYIAERERAILGYQGWEMAAPGDLLTPLNTAYLHVSATKPESRGLGIGQALTQYGMHEGAQRGLHVAATDWRSTNLLASRFWPRQGFQPVAYRLARRIDERVAWAK